MVVWLFPPCIRPLALPLDRLQRVQPPRGVWLEVSTSEAPSGYSQGGLVWVEWLKALTMSPPLIQSVEGIKGQPFNRLGTILKLGYPLAELHVVQLYTQT